MSTTPELIADLISGYTDLKAYFEDVRDELENDRVEHNRLVNEYIADAASHMPVTPNLLRDTKHFNNFCNGDLNKEVEAVAAHGGPWTSFWHGGSKGESKIKVVNVVDMEDQEGVPWGGDLNLAVAGPGGDRPYYGHNFNVIILDVFLTNDGSQRFYVMNQGCPPYTGWNRGKFTVQSSTLFNVIEHSGDIRFYAQNNMAPTLTINGDDLGNGWTFRQAKRTGFGGCHQPHFHGEGHMKVAIALPYVGFGDHRGKFVWAGSVGRYSHSDQD